MACLQSILVSGVDELFVAPPQLFKLDHKFYFVQVRLSLFMSRLFPALSISFSQLEPFVIFCKANLKYANVLSESSCLISKLHLFVEATKAATPTN